MIDPSSPATESALYCPLCGCEGSAIHNHLKDRLYMVPGTWSFLKCRSDNCGLIWLNPKPVEYDLPKIYQKYYTHGQRSTKAPQSLWEYCARSCIKAGYSLVKSRFNLRGRRKEINRMFLGPPAGPAELLEVGCGDGSRLHALKKLGWTVYGQDVDPLAVAQARENYKMRVSQSPLAEIGFADNRFDAIIMNHVIEHIHDPIRLLSECHRILSSNGLIIITTPNVESFGHRTFLRCWRGLEPPRHLHLFSPQSAKRAMRKAGFCNVEVSTTAARAASFAIPSIELSIFGSQMAGQRPLINVFSKGVWFQYRAMKAWKADRFSGEEIVIKAGGIHQNGVTI